MLRLELIQRSVCVVVSQSKHPYRKEGEVDKLVKRRTAEDGVLGEWEWTEVVRWVSHHVSTSRDYQDHTRVQQYLATWRSFLVGEY
eukprot:9466330-Pyramimonas_sp.AAC.1